MSCLMNHVGMFIYKSLLLSQVAHVKDARLRPRRNLKLSEHGPFSLQNMFRVIMLVTVDHDVPHVDLHGPKKECF